MEFYKAKFILLLLIPLFGIGATNCEESEMTYAKDEKVDSSSADTGSNMKGEVIHVEDPGEGNDIGPYIEAALNKASLSDTILLPAGSYKIDGKIQFDVSNKPNIYLKGRGRDSEGTKLFRDYESSEFMINFVSTTQLQKIEVSDIWFQGIKIAKFNDGVGTTYTNLKGIGFTFLDPYVHDCKFQWFSSRALEVIFSNENYVKGLISDNIFLENYGGTGYGVSVGMSNCNSWYSITPGTENTLYIEDNYFSRHRHCVATSKGGRYVFRYNRVERNAINQAVDMHGGQPAINEAYYPEYKYSSRFTEIYSNTFIATPSDDPIYTGANYGAISIRGGEAIIWNNTFKDYTRYSIRLLIAFNYWANEDGYYPAGWELPSYPIDYQIGWESGNNYGSGHSGIDPSAEGAGDVFIWENTYENSKVVAIEGGDPDHPDSYIQEGRDYHFEKRPDYEAYEYPHRWRNMRD